MSELYFFQLKHKWRPFIDATLIFKIFLLFFLFHFFQVNGQNFISRETIIRECDSLKELIQIEKQDTSKCRLLIALGSTYEQLNEDSALHIYNQTKIYAQKRGLEFWTAIALKESGTLLLKKGELQTAQEYLMNAQNKFEELLQKNNKNKEVLIGAMYCFSETGILFDNLGKFELAIENHQKALQIARNLNNRKYISVSCNNIGIIYEMQGKNTKALEYYLKAMKINEQMNNKLSLSKSLINIGNIHFNMNNYTLALDYFSKSLSLKKELNDKSGISKCLNNIGSIYKEQNNLPLALKYFKESLEMRKETNDLKGMSVCYNNMGIVYRGMDSVIKALECYHYGLKIDSVLDDHYSLAVVYGNLAALNNILGKYDPALVNARRSLKYAEELGLLEEKKYAFQHLSDAYLGKGNYKDALMNYKKYKETSDTIIDTDKNRIIAELEVKYQNQKKQQEIEKKNSQLQLQKIEIREQQFQKRSLVVGLVLALLLGTIILRYYLLKKKANKLLALQKEEIEAQRDLVFNQKEQIHELYKELTDSINYARRIQKALLPSPYCDYFSEHFILFKPRDVVSGDFYWYARKGDQLCFVVADCTGHGVPGAFMSMLGITFLNEYLVKYENIESNKVLDEMRDYIIKLLQQAKISAPNTEIMDTVKDGMDIALCVYNFSTSELQFSGANNHCLVVSEFEKNKLETYKINVENLSINLGKTEKTHNDRKSDEKLFYEIKGNKQPIGIYESMKPFTRCVFKIDKGDALYLMSDGYEDQFGGMQGKKFMQKRIKKLIYENVGKSMEEQNKVLTDTFDNWKGVFEQTDDVTVLGLRF